MDLFLGCELSASRWRNSDARRATADWIVPRTSRLRVTRLATKSRRKSGIYKYSWHVDHYLETPMLAMPNIEAGCYKCHNSSPEVPLAPTLSNGRELIKQFGCFGCHKMPGFEGVRKVGPDLATVSGKLTEDWVKKWLANPKDFKSEARMPKFWFNSNNTGVINGVDWDKRNIAEINAITRYLFAKSTPKTLPAKNTSGNAARGKELVEMRGCFGCHAVGPIEEKPNRTPDPAPPRLQPGKSGQQSQRELDRQLGSGSAPGMGGFQNAKPAAPGFGSRGRHGLSLVAEESGLGKQGRSSNRSKSARRCRLRIPSRQFH